MCARGLCSPCYIRWRKGRAPELAQAVAASDVEKQGLASARAHRRAHDARQKRLTPEESRRVRDYSLRKRYGITLDDYEAVSAYQGGRCKVCKAPARVLYVDHRHRDSLVRGLLCPRCNTAVGVLENTPTDIMLKLKRYLLP